MIADDVSDIGTGAARARSVSAPPRLWWMYLLVVFALADVGAGAGQALLVAYNLTRLTTVDTCLTMHGLSTAMLQQGSYSLRDIGQFTACGVPFRQQETAAMVAGAVAVPLAAWLFMVGGGLEMRRRLRRGRVEAAPSSAARAAADRFEAWCDIWQLSGRRRPRLVLAAPGTGNAEAFTTGLPFTRPLIVIPLGCAYGEPASFDVVMLHELAHVRSRDLVWASLVWWTGWGSVLALLAALGPFLADPGYLLQQDGGSLGLALLLFATVLLLRAALLRRRELAADRHAVDVLENQDALLGALGDALEAGTGHSSAATRPGAGSRLAQTVRRAFATHPGIVTRAATGSAPVDRWEGGFAVSAAAGLVAMYTYQIVAAVLLDLAGSASPNAWTGDAAYAAAALLWAALVVPAWVRRAQSAARSGAAASWRGPLTGAVAGLLTGYFLQIPGATPPGTSVIYPGYVPAIAVGMLIADIGAGTLAAAVACGFPDRLRPRHRAAALTGAVIAVSTALAASWILMADLVQAQLNWGSAAMDRLYLSSFAFSGFWRFATALLLIGLVLVLGLAMRAARGATGSGPGGVPLRTHLLITAAAVVAGGAAAALSWELRYRPSVSDDRYYLLGDQRYWICAVAGWVVVAVILLIRGRATTGSAGHSELKPLSRLPAALVAGLMASALSGVASCAAIAVWAHGIALWRLVQSLEAPPWLALMATLVTAPWLILGAHLVDRIRPRAAAAPGPTVAAARPSSRRTIVVVLGTGAVVAVAAAALVGGVLSPLTGQPDDYSRVLAAYAQQQARFNPVIPTPAPVSAPTAEAAPPPGAPDPGRPLDSAAARKALAVIPPLLPPGLALIPNTPTPTLVTKPAACGKLLAADTAADNALPQTADVTQTYTFPVQATYGGIITVTLGMNSFTGPAPDFTAERNEGVVCRQFTIPYPYPSGADGLAYFSILDDEPAKLAYPGYETFIQSVGHVGSIPMVTSSFTETVDIGHNTVAIEFDYAYWNTPVPPSTRQYCEQLATKALNATIRQLRTD